MAITIATTLLNNQSILEKITLVEEIDEQAAEIISGGKSGHLLNKQISAFDGGTDAPVAGQGPDDIDGPDEDDEKQPVQEANFAFVQNRSYKNRNRYC